MNINGMPVRMLRPREVIMPADWWALPHRQPHPAENTTGCGSPYRKAAGPCYRPYDNPVRVMRSRKKGWKLPPNTICVSRPSRFGNPYRAGTVGIPSAFMAVHHFRVGLLAALQGEFWAGKEMKWIAQHIEELRGMNLACWCKSGAPCHADVLIELANDSALPQAGCKEPR